MAPMATRTKEWPGEDRVIRLSAEEVEVLKNIEALRFGASKFLKGLDQVRFEFKMVMMKKYGAFREKGYRLYADEGVIRRARWL